VTAQETPLDPVTAATVASWRRRRQTHEAIPQPRPGDGETPANGIPVPAGAATPGPPDVAGSPDVADGAPAAVSPATGASFAGAASFYAPRDALAERISSLAGTAADQRQAAGLIALLSLGGPAAPAGAIAPVAPPEAATPAGATAPAGTPAPARGRFSVPLPLLLILTAQAVLAASLIHANSAFQDEALYLWAGHLEIAHLLHGTPVPPFATFFSGAPVVYPIIGALADSIGGLAGARLLSLCFMLGATALLWSTTSRLYGRRAAFFAAGIWAVIGPTLHLSAFATFDAMSLFLVALAAWCATSASRRQDATGWILAAAGSLALANATKYASVIFDPVVIGMAWLAACPQPGGKVAARRATLLATCLIGLLALLYRLGGRYYEVGIRQTTLTRTLGTDTTAQVLGKAWLWVGIVVVLAAVGCLIGMARRAALSGKLLLLLLAGTGLLVPLAQARIHTTTSLDKHVAFGAWFAVIAGGYGLSFLTTAIKPRTLRIAACLACGAGLAIPATLGLMQARALFEWPNTSALVAALRPLTGDGTGHLLVETPSIPEYYLPAGAQWKRWSSTWNVLLPGGLAVGSQGVGRPAVSSLYAELIPAHYFSVIALNFNATPDLDQQIAALLKRTPGYRVVKRLPYGNIGNYVIWVYRPHAAAGRGAA
jgi:Dolichyl-phosphate-mannose-protein mannosyltransferase